MLTAQQISSLGVDLLRRRLVLANTVSQVPSNEFSGDNGDTITLRLHNRRDARVQDSPGSNITFDDVEEDSAEVSVVQLYDATRLTDHHLSLQLADFGRQVLMPQTDAVARGAEDQLADVMNDLSSDASFDSDNDPEDTEQRILEAREELMAEDVPPDNLYAAVSPQIATRVLSVPKFVRVNESGTSAALRQGIIGSLYGFTFIQTNAINSGSALFYHSSAFAFSTFPPAQVIGQTAVQSSVTSEQGVSLRTLTQWNPSRLSHEHVVTTFAGAGLVDSDRVWRVRTSSNDGGGGGD